jgi:hypothetical protein
MIALTPDEFAHISQVVTTPQSFFAASTTVSVADNRRISPHASAKRGSTFLHQSRIVDGVSTASDIISSTTPITIRRRFAAI